MNPQLIKIIVSGAIFLHGVAHAIALVALIRQAAAGPSDAYLTVRTWLDLRPKTAALLALPFWLVSTFCFFASALSIWEVLFSATVWRQLALIGAVVSFVGSLVFRGIWPGAASRARSNLNTGIAVAFNLVILAALLIFNWPATTLF